MTKGNPDLTPFSCQYTPQVPELLLKMGVSLGVTTYQAGKFIFLSPVDEDKLVQLPRQFEKPMGIALHGEKLGLVTKDQVIVFKNHPALAASFPKSSGRYDAMWMPKLSYHTGVLDLHDLSWGEKDQLFAVNTLFSSIVKLSSESSFEVFWTPPFIDQVVPEDRCHLNGMVLHNGTPRYATAFNQGNEKLSWRQGSITASGVLIDVVNNEILLDNLGMPHSPMLLDDKIIFLESATGQVSEYDTTTHEKSKLFDVKGFVRGLTYYKDHLFIATSKLRKSVSTFAHLPIAREAKEAAVHIYHYPSRSFVGKIAYISSVDEIYDVEIFPDVLRPNILSLKHPYHALGIEFGSQSFWGSPENKKE